MSKLIKFEITAPGKAILHGEYSVMFGKPAIAGVIGLKNVLKFRESSDDKFKIRFCKFNKEFELNIKNLNKTIEMTKTKFNQGNFPENLDHDEFMKLIDEQLKQEINHNHHESNVFNGLIAVYYLFIGIWIDSECDELLKNGFSIEIDSEMSIGGGLGSSASFAVCLASAFYFYTRLLKNHKQESLEKLSENFNKRTNDDCEFILNYISKWAFCSEKIMHKNPSGVDNTICTYGKIVKFSRGSTLENINLINPLKILLVDTGIGRSTAKQIEKFQLLKTKFPGTIENIINAMGDLVNDAVEILKNYNPDKDFDNLKTIMMINNNLLRAIGTSHEKLEKIFTIADEYNFSSKLTGAGGGGYAIILLPSNYEKCENFHKLCQHLTKENFLWRETTLGGDGVSIHFP